MLYLPTLTPVSLVIIEAGNLNMTPAKFLASRSPATGPGKRRLCYHLHVERDMRMVDVAHWLDCNHTTVSFHVRNYITDVLKQPLRRRSRDASFHPQPDPVTQT